MNLIVSENYQLFGEILNMPNPEIYFNFRTGFYRDKLKDLAGKTGHPQINLKDIPNNFEEFQSIYIELFDVGLPNPPYPLLETHYYTRDPAPATIHENIMFYKAFGLELHSGKELPNHLINQLEFLAYLSNLSENGEMELSHEFQTGLFKAKKDYLSRHIFNWYPKMVGRMDENGLPDYYLQIFKLLLRFFEYDYEQVTELLAGNINNPTPILSD